MSAMINFSGLSDLQKDRIKEIVFDEVIKNPEFNLLHTVYTGVKSGDSIGFAGEMGLMIKAAAACGAKTPHAGASAGEVVIWAAKKWEVFLRECGTDMDHAINQWMLKYGTDYDDRMGTDYEAAIAKIIVDAFIKNLWRVVWFNDTAAALVTGSPAGVITAGTDVTFITWMDGLFKLFFTECVATPARHSAQVGNSQATYALQESIFTAAEGYNMLHLLVTGADQRLKQSKNKIILCTTSVMDRYIWYLESKGQEPAFTLLVNGGRSMTFRGITLYEVPFWDDYIRAYEDDGSRYNYPHRAILTTKENLAVGTQDSALFDYWAMWYDQETEYNYTKAKSDIDVHFLRSYMFQFSY